ncbi:MAG: hypothetical protein ABFR63_03555 [Thermodesulfobacteriota bacterium]
MLPSVLGCFVFSGEQQIIGSRMPPIFKENSIKNMGNLLARTVQMGGMASLNFTDIEMKFNESMLVITPLTRGALLVIICEPNANKSLINMTTGMLSKDIEASMARGAVGTPAASQAPPTPQPPRPETAPPPRQQAPPQAEAEIDAKLAPVLEQVKDAVALAIGPIAGPIMKDTVEIWARQGPPAKERLADLAKLLCEEINDEELEKEFMAEIKKIIG